MSKKTLTLAFVSTDVIYVSQSVLQSHGETNKPRSSKRI